MQINEEKFGFILESVHFSSDANSEVYQFHHSKSGGQLIWLKNEDENRTFGMGFLTPPEDSTGVAHIVEHAVLSGSRKYKVKDPFMQMLKTSMNTFLNAMTFTDMTIYPVSSMNEQDFHNLMDVYLDAVLFPRIYEEPNIFYQEGWHHEIFKTDGELNYNGVVYNEMRGAYSTPDRVVTQQIDSAFHPGSTYAHESGGYPYDIPDLTYKNFINFHAQHYRPENALSYLYGAVDIERALAQLNDEFFSEFQAGQGKAKLELPAVEDQKSVMTMHYDADEQMTIDKDSYLSYVLPFGQANDLFELYLLSVISEALVDAEASPLRKALVEGGFGQDISSLTSDSYYLDFGLILERFDAHKQEQVTTIIEKTLMNVAEEGLNRDLLEAVINRNELEMRQAGGTMRGVMYFIHLMTAWRYDVKPSSVLDYSEIFTKLRENLTTDFYEKVIHQRLVNSPAKQVIVHEPQTGIFTQLDDEVKVKLANVKANLSEEALLKLIALNEGLRNYQLYEDPEDLINTLPKLAISDVKQKITVIPTKKISGDFNIMFHPQSAAGIRYVKVAFPMDVLSAEEVCYAQDLMTLIGLVDTENFDYATLDIELNKVTSELNLVPKVFVDSQNSDRYSAQAILSFSALGENSGRAFELVTEILTSSKFDNFNRIKNILQRVKTNLEENFENSGHQLAISYLRSFYSQSGKYVQQTSGLDYFDHLSDLLKDFDHNFDDFIKKIESIQSKLWHNKRIVVALTADHNAESEFVAQTLTFINSLPSDEELITTVCFELSASASEAITTNSNVQYVAMGGSLAKTAYAYSGSMAILANILSKGYLHELIRAQGGAYGAGLSLTANGDVTAYSYRDPNLFRTIEVYQELGAAVQNLKLTQPQLEQYIIGSMNRFHFPIVAANTNGIALTRYLKNQTTALIEKELQEALSTKVSDLVNYAEMLNQVIAQNNLVVFGNKQQIEKHLDIFDHVRPLKK